MNKVKRVTIFLYVKDLNQSANFYKNIFDFNESYADEDIMTLINSICTLTLTKSPNPKLITFGFIIEDTTSLVQKIKNYGNIDFVNSVDSAHPGFAIKDIDGNEISLNNTNYKPC